MRVINQNSRAIIEFSLAWESAGINHIDNFWADPVSLWRDVLDPQLIQGLLGQGVGEAAGMTIPAIRFPQPYNQRKRLSIQATQFRAEDAYGNGIPLMEGRYYPQGLLTGVDGVFRVSTAPCRFLGREEDRLVFDLNHPLSGHDLTLQATIRAIHPDQKERGGRCEDWLERISADGPGMQTVLGNSAERFKNKQYFRRLDERHDPDFYRKARLVHHLDSSARQEINRQYGRLIPAGARILDLMASWESHLPEDFSYEHLTVLGMNKEELRANRQATAVLAHDLNHEATLPSPSESFDAVICTASIEYLTQPVAVLHEVRRILQPGGLLAIAFSNRWFPPKAIRVWTELHEFERLGLVTEMLLAAGGFSAISTFSRRGLPRPENDPHQEIPYSDPVYMVWGFAA